MSLKDNIDFSAFTDLGTAFDLYSNSIRKAFQYDSYGGKTKFQAIVLTNPLPISPNEMSLFVGTPPTGSESQKISQFVYRGRIVGDNSPHQFLPDPCDQTYTENPETSLKIIEMHTLFVSNIEFGNAESVPRIGSIVEVELEKNSFSYNLSYGKHIKLVFNPDKSSSTNVDCVSLQNIMQNAETSPMWSYEDGENRGGPTGEIVQEIYDYFLENYPNSAVPEEGMCGGLKGYEIEKCKTGTIGGVSCTLHPTFFDKVKEKYDEVVKQNFDEKFSGGSTLRSVKTQISLRLGNATRSLTYDEVIQASSGLCDPPTAPLPTSEGQGSRHIYGLAIDFGGILTHGGTRVAKLENSDARNSKTYKFLLTLEETGFKNYKKEPWHWSVDGK